jgi:predicted PurR-regulated permease PerM
MRSDLTIWLVRGMALALGVAVIYGLITLGIAAGDVLLLVFISVLLASALEPVIGVLRARLPLGRGATILVVYASFFVVVLGLAFVVVPAAVSQGQRILVSLPPFFDQARDWAAQLRPAALSASITTLIDAGAQIFAPAPPPAPDDVVEVGAAVAETAIALVTLLAIVYFWLVEHARLQRYILAFVPPERRAGVREAWNQIEHRLGLWVRGQLILMGAMGAATGIAYTLLGLPGAIILALIAAITEAIPLVGPLLGAIPAIIVAATVSPELAVVVALLYVLFQFLEGSVLVPIVMRNTIGISPLFVLVSILVGGAAGGVVGAFLAVPIVAILEIVIQNLQAREIPVAQDPSPEDGPDAETTEDMGQSLPDSAGAAQD